jgi:multidrug efflux pump subunit AcrA (membrane-fusion protein)
VDLSTVWTDTVKRGPMARQVRGLGTLVKSDSGNLVAKITLPEFMAKEIQPSQNVTLSTPKWTVKGHVRGLAREISNGTASVDLGLEDIALPQGAGAGLQIDATIDIETIDNILYVGRPARANNIKVAGNTTLPLFKINNDGTEAVRVDVKLGRASVNTIEVLSGLKEGDKIILSDMSPYDNADRIHITDEKNLSKP